MKKLSFLCGVFLVLLGTSCQTSKNSTNSSSTENTSTSSNTANQTAYEELSADKKFSSYVGKNVTFVGKLSNLPSQHMMKFSMDEGGEKEKNAYVVPADKSNFYEIVVYYYESKVTLPKEEGAKIRFYGKLNSMSGAGKGGGEHTEIYLDVDKVELVK